jgi:ATP-dependent DNA helicase RecG
MQRNSEVPILKDSLLKLSKLSDALEEKQKRNKIHNLLHEMYKKDETIRNTGSRRKPKWVLI